MVTRTRPHDTNGTAPTEGAEERAQANAESTARESSESEQPGEAQAYSEGEMPDEPGVRTRRRRASGVERADGTREIPDRLVEDVSSVTAAAAVGVAAAVIEAELLPGILIGAGAMLLGKMFPRLTRGLRPVAKMIIRAGIAVTDKTREMVAEAGEQVQDMAAEVRAERAQTADQRARTRAARRGTTAEAAG
jgi:hypothetical protein